MTTLERKFKELKAYQEALTNAIEDLGQELIKTSAPTKSKTRISKNKRILKFKIQEK